MGFGWLIQINGNSLISSKPVHLKEPRNLYNLHKQASESKLLDIDIDIDIDIDAHYLSSDKNALGDIANE